MRISLRIGIASVLVAVLSLTAAAQERDRSKIPDKYKWNLADIYPDVAAWRTAKEKVSVEIPKLRHFQGKLAGSPAVMADSLEMQSRLDKEVSRLYVYASMLADQDTRASEPQGMVQEMQQFAANFGSAGSYIEPEILKAGAATVDKFIASEPRLKVYTFYLKDIVRRAPHTLTDNEEKILAEAAPLAASPSNIYGILSNADFPYPTITLSDGKTVKVDQAGYNALRISPNRADREKVMSAFFKALGGFSRTYGTTMNGNVPMDQAQANLSPFYVNAQAVSPYRLAELDFVEKAVVRNEK